MTTPHVDCHSHVFNAEDLPIDGFIKSRLWKAPDIVTGILRTPLDRLSQWVATSPKTEAAYLASLLRSGTGLEAVEVAPPPRSGSDLVSDRELQDLLLREWQRRDLLSPQAVEELALESLGNEFTDPDELLAAGLASPGDNAADAREELSTWLSEQADPELEAIELEGLEGLGDWVARVKALMQAVARFVDTLRLVTRDRHLVAAEMAQTYGEVSLFVPALVDFEYTSGDAPSATVNEQAHVHSLLSQVSMVGMLPGAAETRIHPIVGYCPYREVATSELRDCEPEDPNPYVPFADPATATEDDRFHVGMAYDPGRAHDLPFTPGDPDGTGGWFDGARRSLDIVRHAVERQASSGSSSTRRPDTCRWETRRPARKVSVSMPPSARCMPTAGRWTCRFSRTPTTATASPKGSTSWPDPRAGTRCCRSSRSCECALDTSDTCGRLRGNRPTRHRPPGSGASSTSWTPTPTSMGTWGTRASCSTGPTATAIWSCFTTSWAPAHRPKCSASAARD